MNYRDNNAKDVDLARWLSVIDRLEDRHQLLGRPGYVHATFPFLCDLQKELGLDSPTQAWAIWKAATDWRKRVAEKYASDADLAFWYGVDPFTLSPEQRVGLLANLPRCKAQKRIVEGNFDSRDPDAVYQLFLIATGSEQQAIKARGDAMEATNKSR